MLRYGLDAAVRVASDRSGRAGASSPKNSAIIRTAVNALGLSRTPETTVARMPLRISVANAWRVSWRASSLGLRAMTDSVTAVISETGR